MFDQGKWKQLWEQALDRADQLQAKTAQNPTTARQRSAKEKSQYAHGFATAGNVSKPGKIVCKQIRPPGADYIPNDRHLGSPLSLLFSPR